MMTYSPSSGLIKVDGAVIGAIKKVKRRYVFVYYKFNSDIVANAATIEELLPKIRKAINAPL